MMTDMELLDFCENREGLRRMFHGTQVSRIFTLAGRRLPDVGDKFYIIDGVDGWFKRVVWDARLRVDMQVTPPGWMAL